MSEYSEVVPKKKLFQKMKVTDKKTGKSWFIQKQPQYPMPQRSRMMPIGQSQIS